MAFLSLNVQDSVAVFSLLGYHAALTLKPFMPRLAAKSVPSASPQMQLDSFLAKYDPAIASLGRRSLVKMRKRVPGAIEMIYDNYNALVIGFGPTERASEAIFSIALYPTYARLFFLQGAGLPDPDQRLEGAASVVRSVTLETTDTLDDPQILSLINTALNRAKVPLNPKQRRQLIIKSVSAKQRPRRPPQK
jgi:hypothetical protein